MSIGKRNQISKELNNAIKIVGDCWVLRIVSALEKEELRFNEIQRTIPSINPVTLTKRLKKLEKEDLIKRKEETIDKISVIYMLTEKGKAILPVVREIKQFADKYL